MNSQQSYPKRQPFFAHRVVRLLFKSCAAQEMGTTATLLVIFVSHTEDAKHYSAPPTFFNAQLLPILGLRKWEALDKARRDAVAAGWLHYDAPPSGTRRPGVYWSTVPERFTRIDDQPSDEHTDHIRETDTVDLQAYPQNGYGGGDGAGNGAGYGQGDGGGEPSIPVPFPKKKRAHTSQQRTKFTPPTVEEVAAYCRARGNFVDPQKFLNYYTSNGWRVGRNPMRDWKAAVCNWERNGFRDGNGRAEHAQRDDEPTNYGN